MKQMKETLEQEFNRYSEYHKKVIMQTALIINERLYKDELLSDINTFSDEKDKSERAYKTIIEGIGNNIKIFNSFYDVCWNYLKNKLPDNYVLEKFFNEE